VRILFDCTGDWTPDSLRGGSEECVTELSRALAAREHRVIVWNGARAHGDFGGVWYNVNASGPVDLVVAWRHWREAIHAAERHPKARVVLWCHDIPVDPHWTETEADRARLLESVHRVVLLNDYHRRRYEAAGLPEEKAAVIPIGLDPALYNEQRAGFAVRDPHRCIYVSHPGRGLDRLRQVWPEIRAAVPTATLAAFWWETEHFRPPIPELGVEPMRALSPAEVADELHKASLLTYPSVFAPEISPASTIKAAAAGAVPVCVIQGGMVDTVQYGRRATHGEFAQAVIDALCQPLWQEHTRRQMVPWALSTYSWERAAEQFEGLAA
jgi:glycosyltransferase involved in cell wall biosynthesis